MQRSIAQQPVTKRMVILDLLRAMAVLLVIGRHAPIITGSSLLSAGASFWVHMGWIGVDLFFVLSGFLVASLLFQEMQTRGRFDLRRFWLRRGLKIYPSFYLLLAITIVVNTWLQSPIALDRLISEMFFLQSYLPRIWNHTWSLAVEEHFYLLLPIFLRVLIRLRIYLFLPLICAILIVTVLMLRICTAIIWPEYSNAIHLYPTHLRIDALLFGVTLAYWNTTDPLVFHSVITRYEKPLLGFALMCLSCVWLFPLGISPIMHTIGFSLLSLGFSIILAISMVRWGGQSAAVTPAPIRMLALIGRHSYSIYLWHIPIRVWGDLSIGKWLSELSGPSSWWGIYILLSLAIGIAVAQIIEFPILRLRDQAFPTLAIKAAK
jgi:peptidoglycan/LPS O-acetylase OafA/YrhL